LLRDLDRIAAFPTGKDGMPNLVHIGSVDVWINHWLGRLRALEAEFETIPAAAQMTGRGAELGRLIREAHRRLTSLGWAKANDIKGSLA
jgi:hypothetical protein